MKTHKHLLLACNLILATTVAFAAPQWTWEAGKQTNNGAITLKSTNSSNTYSGTQNPTGAIAKTNQTAATQPPTVIIQSTASLPIKVEGSSCTSTTSGTSPTQTADEGTAIVVDRSLLLTCQSGSWQKQGYLGGYSFQLSPSLGGLNSWFGIGIYDSASGTFTGEVMCDPAVWSQYPYNVNTCGQNYRHWCTTSNGACLMTYSYAGNTSYGTSLGGVSIVTGLSGIVNVSRKW